MRGRIDDVPSDDFRDHGAGGDGIKQVESHRNRGGLCTNPMFIPYDVPPSPWSTYSAFRSSVAEALYPRPDYSSLTAGRSLRQCGSLVSRRIEPLHRALPLLRREERHGVVVRPPLRNHRLHHLVLMGLARRTHPGIPMRLVPHDQVQGLQIMHLVFAELQRLRFGREHLHDLVRLQPLGQYGSGISGPVQYGNPVFHRTLKSG